MSTGAYVDLKSLVRLRHQAQGFAYKPGQPLHSMLSGRKPSRLRGRGLDFDELRHYRPGDDIRTMDWRVTRRTGTPYVRVYTEERDRPVWLVVDQSLSMFFGSRHQMKSVAAADMAALTAWQTLGAGDRVGTVLFNDKCCQVARPSRSQSALMTALERLVEFNRALAADVDWQPEDGALATALTRLTRELSHDGLIFIISDFSGWDARCLTAARKLRRDNDIIAAVISDPLERDLDLAQNLVVSDGRHQLHIDLQDSPGISRYQQAQQQHLTTLREDLRRQNIPVITIETPEETALQIKRQLGQITPGGPRR